VIQGGIGNADRGRVSRIALKCFRIVFGKADYEGIKKINVIDWLLDV